MLLFIVPPSACFSPPPLPNAPYEAWLPEVAVTSDDRVSLSAWKSLFGVIGAALALVASPQLKDWLGFAGMALVLGAMTMLSYYLAVLGAAGRRAGGKHSNLDLWVAIRATLANRPFLIFAASLVLFNLALNMLTQMMPYFVVSIMGQGTEQVSLYVGLFFARHVGQPAGNGQARTTVDQAPCLPHVHGGCWRCTSRCSSSPAISLAFRPWPKDWCTLPWAGVPIAGLFVFPNALLADVIDYDAQLTGQRREGMYFGVLSTINKLALAPLFAHLRRHIGSVREYRRQSARYPAHRAGRRRGRRARLAPLRAWVCTSRPGENGARTGYFRRR